MADLHFGQRGAVGATAVVAQVCSGDIALALPKFGRRPVARKDRGPVVKLYAELDRSQTAEAYARLEQTQCLFDWLCSATKSPT